MESVLYRTRQHLVLCSLPGLSGEMVPCKTDKGTTICFLWHHDKDGDNEFTDFFRYHRCSHIQQNAVPVLHCTTQSCCLSNKHHTSPSRVSLGPLVALVLAALSVLALAAWNLLLCFLPKIPFPVLCPSLQCACK